MTTNKQGPKPHYAQAAGRQRDLLFRHCPPREGSPHDALALTGTVTDPSSLSTTKTYSGIVETGETQATGKSWKGQLMVFAHEAHLSCYSDTTQDTEGVPKP